MHSRHSIDLSTLRSRAVGSWVALTIAALSIAFTAAASHATQDAAPAVYETTRSIPYRPSEDQPLDQPLDQSRDQTAAMREHCLLDIYAPTNREGFVTVVWLHAGGLRVGNRYVPGELRNQGFAVVAAGYRLAPSASAPDYIEDAAAALAWTFRNIESFGGDPEKIVIAGASAGGYLAMMVGLDDRWLAPYGLNPRQLLGIGSLAGQAITHVQVRAERGISRAQPTIDDLAPLFHVRPDAPPLLLVTGDRELELLGRYEENALLARLMKITGHDATELFELEGFDHAGVEKPAHGLLLRWLRGLD